MIRLRFFILLAGIVIILGKSSNVVDIFSIQEVKAQVTENSPIYLPVALKTRGQGQSPFGVQVYGYFGSSSKYHPFFVESGAEWIRSAVNWRFVEPENVSPAEYSWSAADEVLAVSRPDEGAYQIIATIFNNPEWASSNRDGPLDMVPLTEFTEFVGALVERYDGDGVDDAPGSPVVEYWELYNEPDRQNFWGNSPDKYTEMLAATYPTIKSANSNAKLVFGGIAYDWFEDQGGPFVKDFLDQILASGGGSYFDVMNFHTYPAFKYFWETQGPGLLEKANTIRAILASYGHADKSMVITEAGWHSDNPPGFPSSQEIQSRYVVELYVQSLAANIDVTIWWMLYDPGTYWHANGLVSDGDPPQQKQALFTYITATSQLANTQYVRVLPITETGNELIEAYEFEKAANRQKFYTIWLDPVESEAHTQLVLPHSQVALRDIVTGSIVGTVLDEEDGLIDDQVTIDVSSRPVYVEVLR
jgi:hypothetical protein